MINPLELTATLGRLEPWRMAEDTGPESLLAHIVTLMGKLELWHFHVRNSIGAARGWPDLVIANRGLAAPVLFRELKSEQGRLNTDQRYVGAMLSRGGLDWGVWRPSDLASGLIAQRLIAISRFRDVDDVVGPLPSMAPTITDR